MKLFDSFRDRITSSLNEPSGQQSEKGDSPSRLESLLGRGVGSEGRFSWGVLILVAVALYALVRLVLVILNFFG